MNPHLYKKLSYKVSDFTPISLVSRQPFVRAVVLGRDDQPAGILVDAVDDARTRDAADPRQLPRAMVQQRVDQRAVKVAARRMHDQPRRLVDDDQVFVLERDDEVDVLRHGFGRGGGRQRDEQAFAARNLCRSVPLRRARRVGDRAALDQDLDAFAR